MLSRTPKTPAPPSATAPRTTPAATANPEYTLTGSPLPDGPTTPAMNLSFRGSDLGVSLKEQNRQWEEVKKENFALKLQLNELQGRMSRLAPGDLERTLKEHEDLLVKSEALQAEIKTYKELLFEAQQELDQLRPIARDQSNSGKDAQELVRLREDNEALQAALVRSQSSFKRLEQQLTLSEDEARQQGQRARHFEVELSAANRRLSEANGRLEAQAMEIQDLQEQVRQREDLAMRARSDYSGTAQELSMLTRQVGELQSALRKSEQERNELALRLQTSFNAAPPSSPDGPRSSLDAIESRLMRELGATTKKLSEMEKKTHISTAERDHLLENLKRQSDLLSLCDRSLTAACVKLNEQLSTPVAEVSAVMESGDLARKTDILSGLVSTISVEVQQDKESLKGAERELHQAADAIEALDKERDSLSQSLNTTQQDLQAAKQDLSERNRQLLSLQEQNRQLTMRLKSVADEQVPLLKAEVEQHKQHIQELMSAMDDGKRRLVEAESRNYELSRRSETSSAALQAAHLEVEDLRRHSQALIKERDESLARLAKAESDLVNLKRQHEHVDNQLQHQSKVRSAVEEQFQNELKSLHAANTDLKVQLSAAERSRLDLQRRHDQLSKQLNELHEQQDERDRMGLGRDSELARARQEADMLRIERNTLEAELAERQSQCKRLETDIARLKRDDAFGKRVPSIQCTY